MMKYLRDLRAYLGLVKFEFFNRINRFFGYSIAGLKDYSSPLFDIKKIQKTQKRWDRPSKLLAIDYDLKNMKKDLVKLLNKYREEIVTIPHRKELLSLNLGPGIPEIDGILLYMMVRELKPSQYIEVGSGLSSYYCSLAAHKNKNEGRPLKITCIDPNPYDGLRKLKSVRVIASEVQDVPVKFFEKLNDGDILFIDSTHVVKIDGDVPYIYLEILSSLKSGVVIQSHDIPFPYNIPYPAKYRIVNNRLPTHWNEAMMVQAFLSYNHNFKITMSVPMIRHFDDKILKQNFPRYKTVYDDPDTFSSLWYKKVK